MAFTPGDSPIKKIDGKAFTICPSKYIYNLQDVSDSNAGRTEDALMHKNRIAQKVSINLEWQNLRTADISKVLQAFNPEYITVQYLDALAGDFLTKTFYVGDRSTPLYNSVKDVWENIAFNIIER